MKLNLKILIYYIYIFIFFLKGGGVLKLLYVLKSLKYRESKFVIKWNMYVV